MISDLTDSAFTISFFTGMASAEPTEKDFADARDLGSDLDLCIGASLGSGAGRFLLLGYLGVA